MNSLKYYLTCLKGKTLKPGINVFVISLLFIALKICPMYGQSYYQQLTYGIDENTFVWGWNGSMQTIWTSGTTTLNDMLSPVQTLPFSWNFYGVPVTQYKISDNGYITFDVSATTSFPTNGSLPSTASPNNAIYAFWRDFEITSGLYDNVVTWTYGTAPNRVHCIEWQSMSTVGNTTQLNAAYFAIRIYEGGDLDIVHIWGRYNNADMGGGTVGVENATGTNGTMTVGSPNATMKMPVVLPENVVVNKFIYGTQPAYDMAGLNLPLTDVIKTGTSVTVAGDLINYGSQTITSLDLKYRVDYGSVQTQNVTGLNILPNMKYSFSHNIPWVASGTGKIHNVTVWADNLNGNPDNKGSNDSVKCSVFVNTGIAGSKKALIEEFSTAPCGFCVDGLYITQTILNTYPNAIGFTHHAGYLTDDMTIPESKTYESIMGTGAPKAVIDRIKWPGELDYIVDRTNNNWTNKMVTQMNEVTPVNVTITTNSTPSTRKIDITVKADFVDYPYPGDLRLNAFIIEDSVTGVGDGYDQHNYYSKENPGGGYGGPSHPFYNLPDTIKGFVHRHVIRAMPSTIWGTSGVIPNSPSPGQSFSQNYSYIVPSEYKPKDLSVIAFVSYFDSEYKKLRILNTQQKEGIANGIIGINDAPISSDFNLNVYPNPAKDITIVSFNLNNKTQVGIEIFNSMGQIAGTIGERDYSAGIHSLAFNTENYAPGVYIIKMKLGNQFLTKMLVVSR